MVKVASNMLPLGTKAHPFSLPNVINGNTIDFPIQEKKVASVIMFICNHCPFVKHINTQLTQLAKDYIPQGIVFLAINSNDVDKYPADSIENMKITAQEEAYPFPYLFDESQAIAKAYQAACTPDFFIFDQHNILVYRGQLDDSRPGNDLPVNGQSIRDALDCLLANTPVSTQQKPSIGCNIKWKS